jgi:hypothetical protein
MDLLEKFAKKKKKKKAPGNNQCGETGGGGGIYFCNTRRICGFEKFRIKEPSVPGI